MARDTPPASYSMTPRQVLVAWALLVAQAVRRKVECDSVEKQQQQKSESRMWVGHWLMGLGFYFGTSCAVWVEGLRECYTSLSEPECKRTDPIVAALVSHTYTWRDLAFGGVDLRTYFSIILFILASGIQHDCHAYLASLKQKPPTTDTDHNKDDITPQDSYKLPQHPAFTHLIAPHYTAECLIYLSIALFAAPPGRYINWTMFCALVFVVVNLGVTAHGTKKWYEARFGEESVRGRWRLVPFVW